MAGGRGRRPTKPTGIIEVLPGRLMWAPEAEDPAANWQEEQYVPLSAMQLIKQAGAIYAVPHYPSKALGRAFGPVALDKMLEFCAGLFEALGEAAQEGNVLALTTPCDDMQTRTNVSTMLGVYLVLRHDWSTERLRKTLGEYDACRMFACSWSRLGKLEDNRHHRVLDCWAGIELAKQLEWIDPQAINDPEARSEMCTRIRHWSWCYDGSWIVPGRIVVCADPATTVVDPNPATFKSIFPTAPTTSEGADSAKTAEEDFPGFGESSKEAGSPVGSRTSSPRASNGSPRVSNGSPRACDPPSGSTSRQVSKDLTSPRDAENTNRLLRRRISGFSKTSIRSHYSTSSLDSAVSALSAFEECSTDTVCKEYVAASPDELRDFNGEIGEDFVTHLKKNGVKVMIRCNFDHEPGMVGESYNSDGMKAHGISHIDAKVPDYDGGLPTRVGVRTAIELTSGILQSAEFPSAVAVHCKGGFGRSVVLACCIAIDFFDVPGNALMGWVRMVRPGAITSPTQEIFLKKLTGRRALRRWVGLQMPPDGSQKPGSSSCTPCSLM